MASTRVDKMDVLKVDEKAVQMVSMLVEMKAAVVLRIHSGLEFGNR